MLKVSSFLNESWRAWVCSCSLTSPSPAELSCSWWGKEDLIPANSRWPGYELPLPCIRSRCMVLPAVCAHTARARRGPG